MVPRDPCKRRSRSTATTNGTRRSSRARRRTTSPKNTWCTRASRRDSAAADSATAAMIRAISRSVRRLRTRAKSARRTSSSIIGVQFNVTEFYTVVQDAQFGSILTTTGVPPGTNTIINNAGGDIKTWGTEVQAAWLINDLFSIVATYGYQDNKVDEFQISSEVRAVHCRRCRMQSDHIRRSVPDRSRLAARAWAARRSTTIPCRGSTRRTSVPYNVSLSVVGHGQDDMILVGGANGRGGGHAEGVFVGRHARAPLQWNMEDNHTLRLVADRQEPQRQGIHHRGVAARQRRVRRLGYAAYDRRRADVSDVERRRFSNGAGPVSGSFFHFLFILLLSSPLLGCIKL